MKIAAFEQIKKSLQRAKGYTSNKVSELADATVAAIEELDEKKANSEEITQKIDTAIQNETDIKNLIGQTANTNGSTSAGTVMAKLNKLLTDWTTARAGYITNLNSRLTSTRASRLDNIGTAGDTGGSATAGTIMAKLNALLGSGGSGGLKIKSVQHGKATQQNASAANVTRTIAINQIVATKSILITDTGFSSVYSTTFGYRNFTHIPEMLSNGNQIQQLSDTNSRFPEFNWSVIEFY